MKDPAVIVTLSRAAKAWSVHAKHAQLSSSLGLSLGNSSPPTTSQLPPKNRLLIVHGALAVSLVSSTALRFTPVPKMVDSNRGWGRGLQRTQKLRSLPLRIQSYERLSLFKPGVGQKRALRASSTARNSAILILSSRFIQLHFFFFFFFFTILF